MADSADTDCRSRFPLPGKHIEHSFREACELGTLSSLRHVITSRREDNINSKTNLFSKGFRKGLYCALS